MKGVKHMLKNILKHLKFLFKSMAAYSFGSITLILAFLFALCPPFYGFFWGVVGDYGLSGDEFALLRILIGLVVAFVIAPFTIAISAGFLAIMAKCFPSFVKVWEALDLV